MNLRSAFVRSVLLVLFSTAVLHAADLQSQLDTMAKSHRGKVALYAKNLKTGQTVQIDSDRPVKTASVIKLTILVEAFNEIKAGKRNLTDKVTMQKEDVVSGSGVLPFFDTPMTMTLKDALTQMIIESDNTATNLLIDLIGRKPVNDNITAMGLKNTYLYKKVMRPAEPGIPTDQKQFGLGKTTAKEMAAVMESIERCDLKDQKLCNAMLYMLRNQQYRNCIPHYLETGDTSEEPSFIANKTGSLDEVRNDVAIVYSKAGPIVISAFTYENQDHSWNAENAGEMLIAHMAKAIMDSWSPEGLAKEIPKSGE
jgi:beta-lactamase class A